MARNIGHIENRCWGVEFLESVQLKSADKLLLTKPTSANLTNQGSKLKHAMWGKNVAWFWLVKNLEKHRNRRTLATVPRDSHHYSETLGSSLSNRKTSTSLSTKHSKYFEKGTNGTKFTGRVSRKSGNRWTSGKRATKSKMSEIRGGPLNVTEITGENFSKIWTSRRCPLFGKIMKNSIRLGNVRYHTWFLWLY